jgi:hypothetical protein
MAAWKTMEPFCLVQFLTFGHFNMNLKKEEKRPTNVIYIFIYASTIMIIPKPNSRV